MISRNVKAVVAAIAVAFGTFGGPQASAAPGSGDAVGSTAGQFSVQGGTATYALPLTLPPGLGEMKPELALTYSHNGGEGSIGPGWSVSGQSVITICPKTLAQDLLRRAQY